MSDELLDRATRALAQETDAPVEPDDATLARILDSLEADEGSGSRRTWAGLAAAAALSLLIIAGGPTAWAWSVGVLQSLWGAPAADSQPLPEPPASVESTPVPTPRATPIATPTPPIALPEALVDEPAPVRVRRRRARPVALGSEAQEAAFDPVRAERELFETAHRLHFGGAGSEPTLEAWDAYLNAHPGGRYAPEARYNRALTLVRLGRTSAARRALEDLSAGGYRAPEAAALLDAMGAP